jgi:mevalonate kinase
MPAFTATAPGKIILFGEHSVVYERPAIAAPVEKVRARAIVMPDLRAPDGQIHVQAPDIDLDANLADLPEDAPILLVVQNLLSELKMDRTPAFTLQVKSTIPIAAGMGSGAAVSVAIIRAVSGFLGRPVSEQTMSDLAFDVEKLHHGTPSGIDNTVVTFGKPVYFQRGRPIEFLNVGASLTFVIADTGVPSSTAEAVGDVRRVWQTDRQSYEAIFDEVAEIVVSARQFIEDGKNSQLGLLLDQNHECLIKMGVSSPELNQLCDAARRAGAMGAKLSGAGRGGNLIALVPPDQAESVSNELAKCGAVRVIQTSIEPCAAKH